MNKLIYIFLFIFLCCNNIKTFAQTQEDSKVDSIVYNSDTTNFDEENEDKKERTILYFRNVEGDTNTIQLRILLNDTIDKYKKKEAFNYAIDEEKLKQKAEKNLHKSDTIVTNKEDNAYPTSNNSLANTATLKFVMWAIIIVFMIVVIVLYVKDNNINMFAKRAKKMELIDEINYDNIFEIDYNKQIESAVNTGNFNVAARLGFLKLLTLFSNKKIITYGIEKTNFDYQFQLVNTKYYNSFNNAAFCYDYAWYSGAIINHQQYNQIIEAYKKLETLVS